jgi:hypothetical protein
VRNELLQSCRPNFREGNQWNGRDGRGGA